MVPGARRPRRGRVFSTAFAPAPGASPEAARRIRSSSESPACSSLRGTGTGPASLGPLGSPDFGGSAEWGPREVRLRGGRAGPVPWAVSWEPGSGISPARRRSQLEPPVGFRQAPGCPPVGVLRWLLGVLCWPCCAAPGRACRRRSPAPPSREDPETSPRAPLAGPGLRDGAGIGARCGRYSLHLSARSRGATCAACTGPGDREGLQAENLAPTPRFSPGPTWVSFHEKDSGTWHQSSLGWFSSISVQDLGVGAH